MSDFEERFIDYQREMRVCRRLVSLLLTHDQETNTWYPITKGGKVSGFSDQLIDTLIRHAIEEVR